MIATVDVAKSIGTTVGLHVFRSSAKRRERDTVGNNFIDMRSLNANNEEKDKNVALEILNLWTRSLGWQCKQWGTQTTVEVAKPFQVESDTLSL